MSRLKALFGELDAYPTVVSTDLEAVGEFIDKLTYVLGIVLKDVVVDRAAVELANQTGYPVGSIVYEGTGDFYRFVPYHQDQDKDKEN